MAASRMGFFFKPRFKVKGESVARTANLALQIGMNLTLVHLFTNPDVKPPFDKISNKERRPVVEPHTSPKVLR